MTWRALPGRRDEMRPLRVVARMSEPIVYSGDGMHLDGILAACAYRDLDDRTRRRMGPVSSEAPPDLRLPLSRWVVDVAPDWDAGDRCLVERARSHGQTVHRLWGWRASAPANGWELRGKAEIRKKPALDDMARYTDARSATITSGDLKAYDLALPTVKAREVVWYAHGHPGEVERLLVSYADAIGRKRNLGWGTVMEWRVETIDEDRSVMDGDTLRRRMPVESGVEGAQSTAAIRPPYHHPSRVLDAVEPVAC